MPASPFMLQPGVQSGLSPFHHHPRPTQHAAGHPRHDRLQYISPDHKALHSKGFWDYVASAASFGYFGVGLLTLLSPLLTKNPDRVARKISHALKRFTGTSLTVQQQERLRELFANRTAFETATKKWILRLLFLQGINYYQQAVNTMQPSLIINVLARDAITLVGSKFASNFIFSLLPLAGIFFSMGKRNDIANSNHPEIRREWDFEELTKYIGHRGRSLEQENLPQKLRSLTNFVKDDIRLNFSLKPWREIKAHFRDSEYWKTPQESLWSVSSQTGLAGWILNAIGLATQKNIFSKLGSFALFGAVLGNTSLVLRAWKNRTELDGQLVLTGVPLSTFGEFFSPRFNPKHYFLNGFSPLGGAMYIKGLDLNSKRYRAWVEEIVWLAQLAKVHPELTAESVLKHFETEPAEAKQLEKRLGRYRYDYLMNLLAQGHQQQRQNGTTLAAFLATADTRQLA